MEKLKSGLKFTVLALALVVLTGMANAIVLPAKAVINPLTQTVYAPKNDSSNNTVLAAIRVYSESFVNNSPAWTENTGKKINLTSLTAKTFGLAVSEDGKKLFVAINDAQQSKLRIYDLDSAGLPTGTYKDAVWTPTEWDSPAGIALAGDRVFVADMQTASVHYFDYDTASQNWKKTGDLTDQLTGLGALYGVTVGPKSVNGAITTYPLFITRKATSSTAKELFMYAYTVNGTTKAITYKNSADLNTPTYMAASTNELYVAVKDTAADIAVFSYNIAAGTLTTKPVINKGPLDLAWVAFDLFPNNGFLFYTYPTDASGKPSYYYRVTLPGTTPSTLPDSPINLMEVDGVICTPDGMRTIVSNSWTGEIIAYGTGNALPTGYLPASVSSITPNSTVYGTDVDVTITGKYFLANPTVSFLNNNVKYALTNIDVKSSTQLTAKVTFPGTFPTATTTYGVVVKNPNQGDGILSSAFTITAKPDTQAPALVTNFNAADSENTQSTLTWTNPADSDLGEVTIRRSLNSYPTSHTNGTAVYDDAAPGAGAAKQYVDTGLTNGTKYYYAVFSKDKTGNWNETVTAGKNADTAVPSLVSTDTIAPAAITTLTAHTGTAYGTIQLTWTAVGDDNNTGTATKYIVKYSKNPITTDAEFNAATTYTQTWTPKAAGGVETYTLTGLDALAGQLAYFTIKAQDEVPNTGALGNVAFTFVKDSIPVPTVTTIYPNMGPNSKTTNIVIEGTNFASILRVYIETSPEQNLANVVNVNGNRIEATVPMSLTPGTYHIRVEGPGGTSAQVNADKFTVMSGPEDPAKPSQVTDLTITNGDTQCTLNWTNPADTDMAKLEVRRYASSFPLSYDQNLGTVVYPASGTLIPKPGQAQTTIDTGLTNGQTYYYVVFIKDTSDNWSAVDSTKPDVNAAIGNPTAGTGTDPVSSINIVRDGDTVGSSVTITWTTNPANTAVDVYILNCAIDQPTASYTSYFTTDATKWVKLADNITVGHGQINDTVGTGNAFYIKLITHGTTLKNTDLATNVVGKFDLIVGPSDTQADKFFVSLPLAPIAPKTNSVADIFGAQVVDGDGVLLFNMNKGRDQRLAL